jgi:hypothetical protein
MLSKMNPNTVGGTPHIPMSPDEVAKLPKKELEDIANDYYSNLKDLNDFPWPGIHVTSDGQIFMGHIQGENARDNHVAENKGMTFRSFPKP